MALAATITAAKAARATNPAAFGSVTDAALDGALTLDPVMHRVADQAIARLTAAVKALRPAGTESPAHVEWRAKNDAIQAKIAATQGYPQPPGASELAGALYGVIPREPPFDDGGAATVAEHATALGSVRLLLGV